MATQDRDTVYSKDGTRTVHTTRESNGTGWFVGIIVVLALLAIGYLVFSANSGPTTTSVDVNTAPAVEAPAEPAMAPAPMTEAPAAPAATPMTDAAPVTEPAPAAPATTPAAPATGTTTDAPAAPPATPAQ